VVTIAVEIDVDNLVAAVDGLQIHPHVDDLGFGVRLCALLPNSAVARSRWMGFERALGNVAAVSVPGSLAGDSKGFSHLIPSSSLVSGFVDHPDPEVGPLVAKFIDGRQSVQDVVVGAGVPKQVLHVADVCLDLVHPCPYTYGHLRSTPPRPGFPPIIESEVTRVSPGCQAMSIHSAQFVRLALHKEPLTRMFRQSYKCVIH